MPNVHNGQLYRYIELIEYDKIRRGMSTNGLQAIFGEWLEFSSKNKAIAQVPSPREDLNSNGQAPPPWDLTFDISDEGIVTNYSLTKRVGK